MEELDTKIVDTNNVEKVEEKKVLNANRDVSVTPNMRANRNLYIPNQFYNSNYRYWLEDNNNTIVTYTNDNCFNQYSTTYCDCYDIYVNRHYSFSNSYSCRLSTSQPLIDYNNFNSYIYYREDMSEMIITLFILLILLIYFPYRIISRVFGRWLKI